MSGNGYGVQGNELYAVHGMSATLSDGTIIIGYGLLLINLCIIFNC